MPGDVLHGVVTDAVVLAVVEDRHDVRMVQPRRGPGLAEEPAEVVGTVPQPRVHHLQRHPAAQRLPLGLVDDAHSTAADLADDPVVAQPLEAGCAGSISRA